MRREYLNLTPCSILNRIPRILHPHIHQVRASELVELNPWLVRCILRYSDNIEVQTPNLTPYLNPKP